MELNCAFFLLVPACLPSLISAEVLVEVAIHSWHNPFKIDSDFVCCDGGGSVFPNCTGICDTRFDFCLQPSQFSMVNTNCPLGLYRSTASDFVSDPDSQSFVFGLDIEGNVPNPMTFHLTSYPQNGVRLVLNVFDQDTSDDDLLDILYVPITVSEMQKPAQFSPVTTYTGINGVGTAELSFRVRCAQGFCGSQCSQLCQDGMILASRYLMEVAIHSWQNPSRGDANQRCCDGRSSNFPNCGGECETRFEFCVQPFHFSPTNQNCLFGAYEEGFTESWIDSDNISFLSGQDLESGAPNPMTFFVPASEEHGFKFTLMAYDIDSESYDDQLLDIVYLVLDREPLVSSEFSSTALVTGMYGIGIAGLSYRVMCMEGYCGSDCSQLCDPLPTLADTDFTPTDSTLPTGGSVFASNDLAVLLTLLAIILVVCMVMVVLIILVTALLCRRANVNKQVGSVAENRGTALAEYVDGPTISGDVAVANLHLLQRPSFACNTVNSSSFSIGPLQPGIASPRNLNNSREELIEDRTSLHTEGYYSAVPANESVSPHASPEDLNNMYMNPAYGSGAYIKRKELATNSNIH